MEAKKKMQWLVAVVLVGATFASFASRKNEITLVMVPRTEETVQLGMDLFDKYPLLLISYKVGANKDVSLHGWTGTQWVNVTVEDFKDGNFFRTGPDSALIIADSAATLPEAMVPPAGWCSSVSKINTAEMRPLLHLTGQYFDFSFKEWQWFARRHNLSVDAINPDGLNVAWYNKRLQDHLKQAPKVGASDLQYWESIRQPIVVVPVVEPSAEERQAEDQPAEEPALPLDVDESGNPLASEVPAAVVMGAAGVPEEGAAPSRPADEKMPAATAPALKVPEEG